MKFRSRADALLVPLVGAALVGIATPAVTAAADTNLQTISERSGFRVTGRYDEVERLCAQFAKSFPGSVRSFEFGRTPEGRPMLALAVSKSGALTPDDARERGVPVMLAQGGIHAGEIDGKDAGLMLLRDMTVRGTKRELLDQANFLFVPIFNVDGHERFSRYCRINQRGPEECGWRTNARNLNLNRDYVKADTLEMRAMIRVLREWQPDLYADLHVTDGADYQYDVTYGWSGASGWSPAISAWIEDTLRPALDRGLRAMGHIPGRLIFTDDPLTAGLVDGAVDPRLSTGYGDARHIPTVLLENHSLKPYDQRVLGTYVFLEHILRTLAREGSVLRAAIARDRANRSASIPLAWRVPDSDTRTIEFLGIESRRTLSPISGEVRIEWTGKPVTARVPFRSASEVTASVTRPAAYWIPASWQEVIEKLDLHGIAYERITAPRDVVVEMTRFGAPKFDVEQFEGHVRVTAPATTERRRERYPAGSVRVSTDQPLGTLAVLMLEPSSPDSLFQWGFFNSILSPTEYVESYIMEPMAERMLAEDPKLAAEFLKKIDSDEAFRGNPRARLQWFYERTPFYDERARLYPVGRE